MKTGKIKWFDTTKGFGFVVDDEGGPDILLHANVLRNFGYSSVAEGAIVTVTVVDTDRGQQAKELLSLEQSHATPELAMRGLKEAGIDPESLYDHSELLPARVKWFDKVKGFGFINVYGSDEDIFIHAEILRAYGISELQQSEAISVKMASGPRGKLVIEVRSWDFKA